MRNISSTKVVWELPIIMIDNISISLKGMVFKVTNFLDWFSLPTCLATKTGVSPCLVCKHISITLFSCQFLSIDWGLNKAITKSPIRAPSLLFSIKDQEN